MRFFSAMLECWRIHSNIDMEQLGVTGYAMSTVSVYDVEVICMAVMEGKIVPWWLPKLNLMHG